MGRAAELEPCLYKLVRMADRLVIKSEIAPIPAAEIRPDLGVDFGQNLCLHLSHGDDVAVDAQLLGVDAEGEADELGQVEDGHLEAVDVGEI